ncbi:MAG: glycosyltransferase [Candidatus Caldarchaeum sp.]|nr:glycosyltransferase [Candidatus Caldarchaeum sp.]
MTGYGKTPPTKLEVDLFPSRHPIWSTLVEKPPQGVRFIERTGYAGKVYLLASGLLRVKRLVHFCKGVKLAYGRRWVADMESVKVFFKDYGELLNSDCVARAERRLETGDCRMLMPLTGAAERTLRRYLRLKNYSVEVVYPSFYTEKAPDLRNGRNLVVFVGGSWRNRSFDSKGGREVAEAWIKVAGRYPVKMMMFSSPPPELAKKLAEKGVFVGYVERAKLLNEVYPHTKLIVLPSMMDTVGYSVIEAMNFGAVPIVSDHFAMPEIVGDAGVVVKVPNKLWNDDGSHNFEFRKNLDLGPYEELVERLVDRMHVLLEDDDHWNTISERAFQRMRFGPFSIDERNRKLKRVYERALE